MRNPAKVIGETIASTIGTWYDVSRSVWFSASWSALRSMFQESFFQRPAMQRTIVNYDLARSLYRNDNPDYNYGAGFVRPIIDLTVEYMGLPSVTGLNGDNETYLNECITDYWAPQLIQSWRDSLRDSKAMLRFRQPRLDNPLFTESDRMHGRIDCLPPEMCHVTFDPSDPDLVEKCVITHFIQFDERTEEDMLAGRPPRIKEHEIFEVITPTDYKFFDKTMGQELTTWSTSNKFGFVPVWPQWNEYAADLGGGQSDIEPVLPFITAFHEVMTQTLAAHKYHSTPKAKFKLKDVTAFLKNNFPEVLDEQGRVKPGAKISWSGREIFFFGVDEDGGFIEAKSVLGDSKTLLEFLIDCICVAAEVPRWALLVENGRVSETDASVQPFEKKIGRKRVMFSEPLVMMCKMALVATGKVPDTPRVSWPPVRLEDFVRKAQSIQQIILGMDVATAHEWLSDTTAIKILGSLFTEVQSPEVEKALAKNNVIPAVPAPAPASDTQALPPGGTSTKSNGNGGGSKKAATKAVKQLTTTSPSKS